MIQIGAGRTLRCLSDMLESAIDGTFDETRYDESELSRLESRWKQYFYQSKLSVEQTEKEREELKSLVSDISHQTKTPLSNIRLYSGLLMEQAGSEAEKEMAAQIEAQAEKLEFLIRALVKMSRLQTQVIEVVPCRQQIAPMTDAAMETVRERAEKKHIRITYEVPSEICALFDRKWTEEALVNVMENAVKYSPPGSTVDIRVKEYEFYVCIRVSDQGMGISEEEKAQIFTRFYRSPRVQQEEGVGIGLYLAREILKRENGYIKLESKEGEGSCFMLYLRK